MTQSDRVIAIIPARGGSKGLPGKNVRMIGGKPLIAHSVEHALQAGVCDRVLVTTDDAAIKAAAVAAGAWVPFMRDGSLAEDLTPTEPVLKDALARAEALDDGRFARREAARAQRVVEARRDELGRHGPVEVPDVHARRARPRRRGESVQRAETQQQEEQQWRGDARHELGGGHFAHHHDLGK